MQKFYISQHAQERMLERKVPIPKDNSLNSVGRSIKKKVKKSCQKNGYDTKNFVYYMNKIVIDSSDIMAVYVCKQIKAGAFLIVTVLTYPIKK